MAGPVLGLDACRRGWVGVVVEDGRFVEAVFATSAGALIPGFAVVGVDIPIGTTVSGQRACDVAARSFVGARRSSVFNALPTSVLSAGSYAEAAAACVALTGKGLSQQSWGLVAKTREVAALRDAWPVYEVHPEVSFRALHGEPLPWPKTTWNGLALRQRLLASAGVVVPDSLGLAGTLAAPNDVLDAAAVAWTATRIASGRASTLPDPPELDAEGRPLAIWY
ncbi:MAG TPA: DUF429 domain-containing protein [Acidimicrobiales bacterium]|nr:DUF429 domain-containing protein [Acidimicrobiales bacterium]